MKLTKSKYLGSICVLYRTSTRFRILINEKCPHLALLVRTVEIKHKDENIFSGELLPGVPRVSRNQKLSTEYEFCSLKVSLEVLIE